MIDDKYPLMKAHFDGNIRDECRRSLSQAKGSGKYSKEDELSQAKGSGKYSRGDADIRGRKIKRNLTGKWTLHHRMSLLS